MEEASLARNTSGASGFLGGSVSCLRTLRQDVSGLNYTTFRLLNNSVTSWTTVPTKRLITVNKSKVQPNRKKHDTTLLHTQIFADLTMIHLFWSIKILSATLWAQLLYSLYKTQSLLFCRTHSFSLYCQPHSFSLHRQTYSLVCSCRWTCIRAHLIANCHDF